MAIKLTAIQEKLKTRAFWNGRLTRQDFFEFYASNSARKQAMERMVMAGIIKHTENPNLFVYAGDDHQKNLLEVP